MRLILLTCSVLFGWCYASENGDGQRKGENGYAFYYPLAMEYKQPAKVCLEIDEKLLPGKVNISFENYDRSQSCEPHAIDRGFSCWDITAPEDNENKYGSVNKIQVEIETKDKKVKFSGQEEVELVRNVAKVFLETDRRVYKKGDTVKIRFLALGFDLRPLKDYKIQSLQIRSPYPSQTIVKQWENITTNLGLAQIEFQLAPDTPEGVWTITGSDLYASFEVKKYILPRFQASIEGPGEVYEGLKSISYSVCGKYSYGRNVKGTALIVIKYEYSSKGITQSQTKRLNGGCAKFEFLDVERYLEDRSIWLLDITASITEDGTGQVESSKKDVHINRVPYTYHWTGDGPNIKPELPYKARLQLDSIHIPLNSSGIQFCYAITGGENIACSNFAIDSDNSVEVTVPPLRNLTNLRNIEIKAYLDESGQYTPINYVTVWHSDSKNAIKILKTDSNSIECGSTVSFTVVYNSERFSKDENIEFKFILSTRNEILSAGSVFDEPKHENLNLGDYPNVIGKEEYELVDNPVDKFQLKIELDSKVYTDTKLLVYYHYDNEVISDYVDISVTKCTPNKVKAKWAESPLYPGEVGKLNIKTDSKSLCSISSVDKASKFLGSSDSITTDNILGGLIRYGSISKVNCIKPDDPDFLEYDYYFNYYSSLFDAFDSFRELNVGVISNMKFISKTCAETATDLELRLESYPGPAVGIAPVSVDSTLASNSADSVTDNRGSAIRSFFPETWLWDLVPVGENGEATIERKLPDSITDWVGNVLCVSSKNGVGLSEGIEMKAFKPFFLDILLPYSIKRNKEILHLPIPIFNYLNHSLPIRVSLEPNDDVILIDGDDKKSFTACLAAEDSYTHNYRIKSTKIGYAKITVSADVDPSYAENCAPESVIRRRDVVQKSLLVEPEGYPSSLLKGALLCANDSSGPDNIDWQINLPENVVLDTVDGKVIINSDILGPMFQNLENILVVPTGCGEQTMATLSPNLYVLKYLEANNALTKDTKENILKNLEIGYQRMLNYVHDDGSFSAFGKSDEDGSMFLTAFVIRTFKQMKKYIFIDDDVINKAIKWIVSHQLENGCFDPVHHVFHEMGLASSKNQTTALTSYVLISVLETDIKIEQDVFSKAKECILSDVTVDNYTLAISSYALGLMNLTEDMQKQLDKLTEVADHMNGSTWWAQSEESLSANVEVSSYVVLSLLQQNSGENLGTASSIVRYLQSQMNPRGGFFTTQDTVIGLDAISRYATLVNKNEPNVKISVATNTDSKEFEIQKRDPVKTEVIPLTTYPNKVDAKISGNGCVSIQAVVNYYLDKPLVTDDLKLDITLKPVYQKLKCSVIEIKPCVSYKSPGSINMAIVEVTLLSGYAPDEASLYQLTSSTSTGVKKFEQIKNQVVFYLIQLGSTEVCLPFKIEENLIIENVANATVKLYDYYKPELSVSKSFTLDDCTANIGVEA